MPFFINFSDPGVINSSSLTFDTSSYSVDVSWDEPLSPNGVITNYTVWFQCAHVVLDMSCNYYNIRRTTNDSRTTMDVTGLRPYKRFVFHVAASTSVGLGNFSEPRHATTDIAGLWILFVLSSPITGQTLWIFCLLYPSITGKTSTEAQGLFQSLSYFRASESTTGYRFTTCVGCFTSPGINTRRN